VKRLVLLVLALAAFAPATATTAHAAVPCRDRIYNDWYADGKIATTYPLSCYADALKHVPTDAREYSSLADDIRSAMLGARQRLEGGTKVPAEIGRGTLRSPENASDKSTKTASAPHDPSAAEPGTATTTPPTTPPSTLAIGATNAGSGSGIPVPLLVLGALAILLAAAGLVGTVAKRRRT
jgi:hypothetical protein